MAQPALTSIKPWVPFFSVRIELGIISMPGFTGKLCNGFIYKEFHFGSNVENFTFTTCTAVPPNLFKIFFSPFFLRVGKKIIHNDFSDLSFKMAEKYAYRQTFNILKKDILHRFPVFVCINLSMLMK